MTETEFEELELRAVGRIPKQFVTQILPEGCVRAAIAECQRGQKYLQSRLVHLSALLSVSVPDEELT